MQAARDAQDAYIKSVATTSPADQIHKAKQLLDEGGITAQEYEAIKRKALE